MSLLSFSTWFLVILTPQNASLKESKGGFGKLRTWHFQNTPYFSQLTVKILRYQGFSFQKVFKISQHPVTFGWFCVHVSQKNGYNLVIFSAKKMFLNFFLHKIQWGIQWYHQILCFIALLLSILKKDFEQKRVTLRLWTLEKNIKSKSLIFQLF